MSRHLDWQNRLTALIEKYRHKPFDFVTHNCLLWAGHGVYALTGKNPSSYLVGKYKDEKSAFKYLTKVEKVKSVPEFLTKKLGQEDRPIAFARLGDIVLTDPANAELWNIPAGHLFGKVPGICYGNTSYFVGVDGLIEIETLRLDSTIWVS